MRARAIAIVLGCLLGARAAQAQRADRLARFTADSTPPATSAAGIAFVASAILPGSGQFYLRSDRWVPFTSVEIWAWVKYAEHKRRSRVLERQYRDLAWNVARRITASARKDSVFTYYEAMGEWHNSGLFDADPQAGGIQPEMDSTTFNGAQWKRARALFLRGGISPLPGTAEYEKALAYYRTNAIPEPYIWSWGNSRLEQQEFQETIARSDAAFRNATTMMGVILANHVVSAVDALVMARVKLLNEHRIRIGTTLEPGTSSYLWTTTVQIPLHGAESVRYSRTNR